jgi:hypothetical protein
MDGLVVMLSAHGLEPIHFTTSAELNDRVTIDLVSGYVNEQLEPNRCTGLCGPGQPSPTEHRSENPQNVSITQHTVARHLKKLKFGVKNHSNGTMR